MISRRFAMDAATSDIAQREHAEAHYATHSHTPGPWHRNIKPATRYNTVWAGRNTHVLRVVVDGLSEGEVEANICLASAAPELLAAAQAFVKPFEGIEMVKGNAVDLARAAIAKATGSTPC